MGRLDGWRREAREEDIDGTADQQFNNEASSVYRDKFNQAKRLIDQKIAADEIRKRLSVPLDLLVNPYNDGRPMPIHYEASNRAKKRLANPAAEAVEDALAGKEPRRFF